MKYIVILDKKQKRMRHHIHLTKSQGIHKHDIHNCLHQGHNRHVHGSGRRHPHQISHMDGCGYEHKRSVGAFEYGQGSHKSHEHRLRPLRFRL